MTGLPAFDQSVRLKVYEHFIEKGHAPSAADVAGAVGKTEEEVRAPSAGSTTATPGPAPGPDPEQSV